MQNRYCSPGIALLNAASGLPNHQLWSYLTVAGGDLALFEHRLDAFKDNSPCARAHRFHRLAHCGQRRSVERRGGNIIETDHRAMLRHAQPTLGKGSDGAEGSYVVESKNCGERIFLFDQSRGEFLTGLETGKRIARFRQVDNQPRIDFKAASLGAVADAAPAGSAVGKCLGAADKRKLAMTERVHMLERHVAADFVVNNHATHLVPLQFAADENRRNAALFQIGE